MLAADSKQEPNGNGGRVCYQRFFPRNGEKTTWAHDKESCDKSLAVTAVLPHAPLPFGPRPFLRISGKQRTVLPHRRQLQCFHHIFSTIRHPCCPFSISLRRRNCRRKVEHRQEKTFTERPTRFCQAQSYHRNAKTVPGRVSDRSRK